MHENENRHIKDQDASELDINRKGHAESTYDSKFEQQRLL